jgi:hypothetical protein
MRAKENAAIRQNKAATAERRHMPLAEAVFGRSEQTSLRGAHKKVSEKNGL